MRPGTAPAVLGGVLLLGVALGGVLADRLAPHDPLAVELGRTIEPPSAQFPLGTDHLGRCVLSRTLFGARASLGGSALALALAMGIGTALGMVGALGGTRIDAFVRGATDVGLAFPGVALALVAVGLLGTGLTSLVVGLSVAGAAWWARLVHDLTRVALSKEYVLGAQVVGLKRSRILTRYLAPQVGPLVLVTAAWRSSIVLGALAGLSYLGLGPQPPAPEWGAMLHEGRVHFGQSVWPVLAPGAALTLTVGACVLLAEGLRDMLDLPESVEGLR
jgi:ABC-type dipeptide/oligopeptide/nickel transport system permease subunit